MTFDAPWLKALRMGLFAALYVVVFILFAYVCFPYDRLRNYVVDEYNAKKTGPQDSRLEVDDLSWSWNFPGLTAQGVRLLIPRVEADSSNKPSRPQVLSAREVHVTASLLSLLAGEKSASFGATALGGEIDGWVSESKKGRRLRLNLDSVDPGRIPQVTQAIGLPVQGRMTGQIELDVPGGKLNLSEGQVDLRTESLQIGDGKAKIKNLMALPALNVGSFVLKADVAKGRVKLKRCVASGGDLDLELTGGARLRPKLATSTADMELKFRLSDRYKTKDAKTKAIFGDGKIPGLFDTVTKQSLGKLEDGGYGARLIGSISRLKPRPLAVRKSRASRSKTKK